MRILYNTALILEDDEDDQEMLKAIFKEHFPQLQYYIFDNGFDGLNFLTARVLPDIILSDISMPKFDGKRFLNAYNQLPDPVPVVMMSTSQSKKDKDECLKLGASYYLVKPSTFNELLKELYYVLPIGGVRTIPSFSFWMSLLSVHYQNFMPAK